MDQDWRNFCQRYASMNKDEQNQAWASLSPEQKIYFQSIYGELNTGSKGLKPSQRFHSLTFVGLLILLVLLIAVIPDASGPDQSTSPVSKPVTQASFYMAPQELKIQRIIKGTLADWVRASVEDRSKAAVQMTKNLEKGRKRDYSGKQGRLRLIADAYALQVCIDEVAIDPSLRSMSVADIGVTCVILIDSQ